MKFAALVLVSAALMSAEAAAQTEELGAPRTPFERCVAIIDRDPALAYETGMSRSAMTGEVGGFRCAAMALAAQGRNEEAARRFDALANSVPGENVGLRVELLYQAGNAWLLARDPAQARSAFSRAVVTAEGGGLISEAMPDVYIDRARAYALEADWRHAEEDLSRALDLRANDALAFRLRSYARMQQGAFDLAENDALAAVALAPDDVEALLMLGHAREAKRTGAPVEAQ
jgi:tetratricopeptide (TPR) repeat protein